MAEEVEDKKRRMRSPAYPFINLEAAIRRAKEFHDQELRNAASIRVAVRHWNYAEGSSGGLQTAAALISFSLLKDEGIGDRRKLQLTPNAIRILLDTRPDSVERAELIKKAALTPKIHRQLWQKWGASFPSDAEFRHTLLVDWEPPFNKKSVDGFIKEYKDTIAFAKLSESDRFNSDGSEEATIEGSRPVYIPKIGDYVQWESGGILQLPEPKRVRAISPDGSYALIGDSSTGIPVAQLIQEQAPVIPKVSDFSMPSFSMPGLSKMKPPGQVQEDVFSLKEGRVLVQWPTTLSKESVQDLKDWLRIVERKFDRAVPEKEPDAN